MGFFDSGVFGGITDALFGGIDESGPSGAFGNFPQLGQVVGQELLRRLQTPTTERQEFQLGVNAIQDALTRSGATARQRFGDAASAGGFLDSGAVDLANLDIARAEMAALETGIRDLILGFEDQKIAQTFPFLGLGSQEHLGVSGQNLQGDISRRGQNLSFIQSLITGSSVSDQFGSASGLGIFGF